MTLFQINSIVDASAPFYGQLVKAEGKENENVSVTATQGTQTWVKVAYLLYLTFLKARVISPALIIHTFMCTVYIFASRIYVILLMRWACVAYISTADFRNFNVV